MGVSVHPSQFHDWMATFAEIAGVPSPAISDGVSLVPDLTGSGRQREGVVYCEYMFYWQDTALLRLRRVASRQTPAAKKQVIWINGLKGVRTNITTAQHRFGCTMWCADPGERKDLAAGNPALQARFQAAVLQQHRPDPHAHRPYDGIPIPAVTMHDVAAGVRYRTFTEQLPWVPDFSSMSETGQGQSRPSILSRVFVQETGLEVTGYLRVPATGEYTIFLAADAGDFCGCTASRLWIAVWLSFWRRAIGHPETPGRTPSLYAWLSARRCQDRFARAAIERAGHPQTAHP